MIAYALSSRYHLANPTKASQMDDPAELERRLRAGGDRAWLRPGEIAAVLRVSRSTVGNWLAAGKIRYRMKAGGIQRLGNPVDVLRLLDESREDQPSE